VIVLILFPNFVTGLGPLEHLWSIGLEEQFYLTWPWVLKQKEKLIPIIAGIILVKLLVLPAVLLMNTDSITNLFYSLRFECMAIGGLGAYLYHTQNKHLALLYSKPAQVLSLGCIILLAVTDIPLSEPMILITAFLFMVLILNLTTFSIWGPRLETPALNVLGRVSYGIYMFHNPLLYVVLYLLHQSGLSEGAGYNAILFGAVVSGTLILSFLSYRLLESPFLYIKKRFAFVQTRT
jgi:peptidoglycan/LPS O-acetylase OafA/YrhL